MKNNLSSEIYQKDQKLFFYRGKILDLKMIKSLIHERAKKISKFRKGIVSISTQNKLEFIINFYACNKLNFPVFINDNSITSQSQKNAINLNYIFKRNNLVKINKKFQKKYFFNIVIKSSGSSSVAKYVYIKNESISHISKEMNKQMFSGKKKYDELIFAPIYHAFGFGRLHSLMTNRNNIILTDTYSISNFFSLITENDSINGISIPSKILSSILKIKKGVLIKLIKKKIKYFQVSTGYLDISCRRKILNLNINLFLNYGMTEAMRSTFLNLKKHKNKIHTEGRPIKGVKLKIKKNMLKNYGEILVKGRNLAYGYNNENEWKRKFVGNFFNTGDIGYLDKENFLIFKSRLGNKIEINGKTFLIDDIEKTIKNFFNIKKLKIIREKKKIYLIAEKKLNIKILYKFLKKKRINITFDKILKHKIHFSETGKFKFSSVKRLING